MTPKKKPSFYPPLAEAEAAYEAAAEVEGSEPPQAPSVEPGGAGEAPAPGGEDIQARLTAMEAQAKEYLDGWQRTQAEFINFRKRIDREQEQQRLNAVGTAVKRYLPVVDDLERAIKNVPDTCQGIPWVEGIGLIYQKMLTALEIDGVKSIGAVGELFDPNLHEAIGQAPSEDIPSGHVIEVLQKGYLIGDKVLRPAMVRVAA